VAGKTSDQLAVGILALQGDVALHVKCLEELGLSPVLVRMPEQLKDLDGLIIPGGESTALLKLAEPIGMLEAIKNFARGGGNIFGTCAGAIILAREVTNPSQASLQLIDITIERNAYGRQLDSSDVTGRSFLPGGPASLPLTFIRAPRISSVGKKVKVLVEYKGDPVLARQDNILAATFHPELSGSLEVYKYWLDSFTKRSPTDHAKPASATSKSTA
jgi:5'-phosphate synthase pdxT subunit